MKNKKLIPIFVIVSILFSFMAYNFAYKVINFNEHRKYFEQPIEEQVVKAWMTLSFLKREYSIDIEEVFTEKLYFWKTGITIKEYCDKYEIDCEELLITIEELKNGN